MEISITTHLFGKDEYFRYLALAHYTGLPILLIGPPGVAKTQILTDYCYGVFGDNHNKFINELSFGTKPSEIRGTLNIKKYLEEKIYQTNSPITQADAILINEVDKGSPEIRNCLLSIMREKCLFLGDEIKECRWKLFAGACNEIPEEERTEPFWDRFLIKVWVNRQSINDFNTIWKFEKHTININFPDQEISTHELNYTLLNKYLDTVYDVLSDRTLVQIPKLFSAIKTIWKCHDFLALEKLSSILTPDQTSNVLKNCLNQDWLTIRNQIYNCLHNSRSDIGVNVLANSLLKIEELEKDKNNLELVDDLKTLFLQLYNKLIVLEKNEN